MIERFELVLWNRGDLLPAGRLIIGEVELRQSCSPIVGPRVSAALGLLHVRQNLTTPPLSTDLDLGTTVLHFRQPASIPCAMVF